MDSVEVHCELQRDANNSLSSDEVQKISKELQHHIKTVIGITTRVRVLPAESLQRTETGKARRVIDTRPKQL
jgi:phenylacetate-CoA ligase